MPATHDSYNKYGVPRSVVRFLTYQMWRIPDQFRDCFQATYLLSWKTSHLKTQIREAKIEHRNITYQVLYKGLTPSQLDEYTDVWLSFRCAQWDYDLPAVVIISPRPNNLVWKL